MNLFVGGGVFLQQVPEQAGEILLADTLAGVFRRTKIDFDIPVGPIDRLGPEVIGHIEVVRDAAEEQQRHIGKDRIKIKGADTGQAGFGLGYAEPGGQLFGGRADAILGRVGRIHAVMVEQTDIEQARELLVFQHAELGNGPAVLKRQMIQLVLGVQSNFPVGVLVHSIPLGQRQFAKAAALQLVGHPAQVFPQALGWTLGQMNEDKAFKHLGVDRAQAQVALVGQIKKVLLIRHPGQFALGVIRPGVKAAGERAFARALFVPDELIATVGAHIMKAPHLAVPAPHNQDRGATHGQVFGNIIAGVRNLLDPADVQPGPPKYLLPFELEMLR